MLDTNTLLTSGLGSKRLLLLTSVVFGGLAMVGCDSSGIDDYDEDEEEDCPEGFLRDNDNNCIQVGGDDDDSTSDTSTNNSDVAVVIYNDSNYSVWYVYVARCTDEEWGDDQLGNEIMGPGDSLRISGLTEGCWDLMASEEGAEQYTATWVSYDYTMVSGDNPWTLVD